MQADPDSRVGADETMAGMARVQDELRAEVQQLAAENAWCRQIFAECFSDDNPPGKDAEPRTRLMLAAYEVAERFCDEMDANDRCVAGADPLDWWAEAITAAIEQINAYRAIREAVQGG